MSEQLIIESFYKTVIDSVYDMIFLHDLEGNILDVNRKAVREMSYTAAELCSMQVFDLHPDDSNLDFYNPQKVKKEWQQCAVGDSVHFELEHVNKDGSRTPVEISAGKVENEGEEYFLAFVRDISKRRAREKEIEYLSYHDHLTGLFNRRYFEEKMEQLDSSMLPLSIIMGDLNGLKIVNNSHGHTAGDRILTAAAEILKKTVPESAILARYGGDEFIIALPVTDSEAAHKVMYQIKEQCQQIKAGNFPVSIGMGTATLKSQKEKVRDIVKIADKEMNHNKLLETNSANNKMVQGLLSALRAKSDETVEHTERMTELAEQFGSSLGIHNSQLNRLELLAVLHDIGKTSIPGSVLSKKGPLNDQEWEMIKGHPSRGYKIAAATTEFSVVAEEILSHHERWDGQGYPRGLAGEKIPFLARIISIVDAYDVMISGRPYQQGIKKEAALEEIAACAGSQFDPELAAEFIKLIS
ncbi:MAG: HD domain-containing phosphohydrolase [Halanaerobium sp.]